MSDSETPSTHSAPTIPLYYSHYTNGMYYYVSSCCEETAHYGLIVSLDPIDPNELGCYPPFPISGPSAQLVVVPDPPPVHVPVKIERIMGNEDIGNADPSTDEFHVNPVGITASDKRVIRFNINNPLLERRAYELRTFNMTLKLTNGTTITSEYRVANCIPAGANPEPLDLTVDAVSAVYNAVNAGRLVAGTIIDAGESKPLLIVNSVL